VSEVPENWLAVKLADISKIEMGQSPDSRSYNNKGEGLPFFQGKAEFGKLYPTVRKWCTEPTKIAESGDILLSVRAPVGPTNLALEKCCIGRGLAAIRAETPIDQKYLFHYFRNIEPWLSQQGTGTTFAAISGEFIRNLEVSVAPLNEQKRIADKLDSLLAKVDACQTHLDRVPQILKQFRQSVLAAATSGRLTEDWEGNREEWKNCTLGSVITDIRYGTAKKSIYGLKNGIPVLRIPNIISRKIDPTDLKFAQFDEKEIETLSLKTGDLLLIRSNGSVELVGKVAAVDPEFEGYMFAGYLIRLRFDPEKVNPDFISLYLSSPAIRDHIEHTARSTSGVNNINSEEVKAIPLELPSLEEQSEIVHRIENLFILADRIEARWKVAQERVGQITPSLLAKAFRGELVEQDPSDEPASELSKRIKITRENTPKEPRKPRRRTDMAAEKTEKDDARIGIIQILQETGEELSAEELFLSSGYPKDAESELVEEFFVEVRDALINKQIKKRRHDDMDWFSLSIG
jgi:type I restriction enzyme, S subunit